MSGIKKATVLLWCLKYLTDRTISVISQDRLRRGADTIRNRRTLNPEPQQRAHSPQLAAGLASEYKIRLKVLTVEDSLQLAAGFFNPND